MPMQLRIRALTAMSRSINRVVRMLGALSLLLGTVPLTASAQEDEPIGRFAVDAHGSFVSFGQSQDLAITRGFMPFDTPGRGTGLVVGAHHYFFRWNVITFGIGGSFHTSRGDRPPSEFSPDPDGPVARKKLTAFSPQISFNFGGRNGWSYISGGMGTSRLSLYSLEINTPQQRFARTLNYGGGARWFTSEHLAFSLDLRFYAISPLEQTDDDPRSPRMTVMALSIGASFK